MFKVNLFNVTGRQLLCGDVPMFDCIQDWENEIERCKCMRTWRVTDVNMSYDLSQR